jgi:hypothetical protein
MSQANNTDNTSNTNDTDNTDNTGMPDNTAISSDTDTSTSKPGPQPSDTATRNRQQVPMYLPDSDVTALNQLYERLDGQSKIAGDGGIEKHADFMEALVAHAIEHEDELSDRIGIPND